MKKFLVVMAIVSLFALPAFASMTEIMSMGYIPVQISGTDQITQIYPQLISDFKNSAVVEFGFGGVWGYTYLGTSLGTIGIFAGPSTGFPITASVPASSWDEPNNATGLFYATPLGGINLGASLIFGNYGDGTTNKLVATVADKDAVTYGYSMTNLNLGASLKIGLPIDLSISLGMPGYKDTTKNYNAAGAITNDNYETLGGLEIGLNAGTKMGSWMFDIGLSIANVTNEEKVWLDAAGDGIVDSNMLYTATDGTFTGDIIVGYKLEATKTMSFIFGSGVSFNTYADEKDVTENKLTGVKTYSTIADSGLNLDIPLNVAVNCKLNDTFTFMAGISKTLLYFNAHNDKTVLATDGKTVTNEDNYSEVSMDSGVNASLGVAAQLGDLKIEWMLNPMLLLTGPEFISGSGAYGDGDTYLASNVALCYKW